MDLTLAAARHVVEAAEKSAADNGWPAVISVVNDAGQPLLEKMDNAEVPAGLELASGKARTAALFHRHGGDSEDAINGKPSAAITARDFVLLKGVTLGLERCGSGGYWCLNSQSRT